MPTLPLLIIQMGLPPAAMRAQYGEQAEWMRDALASVRPEVVIVRPEAGEPLPLPTDIAGAIITGSWSMVTDREGWSERVAEWIRSAFKIAVPVFGVCYGHQLMAHALGGRVDYLADGAELGTLPVTLDARGIEDAALLDYPATFQAHLSHSQTVVELPAGATCLAYSARDKHQIVRYTDKSMSVQFHPEFTDALITYCVSQRQTTVAPIGDVAQSGTSTSGETPYAHRLLLHFAASLR
jgi:GMP synthase (glutamine-hydrolysing)